MKICLTWKRARISVSHDVALARDWGGGGVATSIGGIRKELVAFSHEVDAQAGKTLTPAQAASLLTQVQDIEAALGC